MKTDYYQRLLPVIRHLEQNFDQPLNLEKVASLACLSPYHFHRTFKAVMGETLSEYLRRLRLQRAADDLFYKKPSITEVALNYGFSSSQSLAKAFRQHYDLTPTDIRDCDNVPQFTEMMRNSKIGHVLRKAGHAQDDTIFYDAYDTNQRIGIMRIEEFKKGFLAYVRVTGPYGENYEPATGQLYGWAGPRGLADKPCLFIYHDNPEVTPAEKCRTDICLLLDEEIETSGGVELKPFEGGKYAAYRVTITEHSQYAQAWDEAMEDVVKQELESDDRPCFEYYHSYDVNTHVADVSICTAIK